MILQKFIILQLETNYLGEIKFRWKFPFFYIWQIVWLSALEIGLIMIINLFLYKIYIRGGSLGFAESTEYRKFVRQSEINESNFIISFCAQNQQSNSVYFQFSSEMTFKSKVSDEQIQTMLKEKVVDLNQIMQRRGFIYNFVQLAQNNFINLTKNIFGDYSYDRRNRFSVQNKSKILVYLKEKSLLLSSNLAEQNKKNYYNYDPNFFSKKPKDLAAMREMVLQGKSQVDAAESNLQRLKSSRDFVRLQFLNEAAYEFDRQRYCSIYWGILTGCLINSTIYKKGRTARKAALLVTITHIFGQISYHLNLDKYFDSVYAIFQQQAEAYMQQDKKRVKPLDKKWIKNQIEP